MLRLKFYINQSVNQNFNVTCKNATSLNRLMGQCLYGVYERDKTANYKYVYNNKFRRNLDLVENLFTQVGVRKSRVATNCVRISISTRSCS